MLHALLNGKKDKKPTTPNGKWISNLKVQARTVIRADKPLLAFPAFNGCFKHQFWLAHLVKPDMSSGNRTTVSKVVATVADHLAAHIANRGDILQYLIRHNFVGASVFLKTCLIYEQNGQVGAVAIDPSLVNTELMVDNYFSPAIARSLSSQLILAPFKNQFKSPHWLGSAETKRLHHDPSSDQEANLAPADGLTVTVQASAPIRRIELPKALTSRDHPHPRILKRVVVKQRDVSLRTSSKPPAANQASSHLALRITTPQAAVARPADQVRRANSPSTPKTPRALCKYYQMGQCHFESRCRNSHSDETNLPFTAYMDHPANEAVDTSQESTTLTERLRRQREDQAENLDTDYSIERKHRESPPNKRVSFKKRKFDNVTSSEEDSETDNSTNSDSINNADEIEPDNSTYLFGTMTAANTNAALRARSVFISPRTSRKD